MSEAGDHVSEGRAAVGSKGQFHSSCTNNTNITNNIVICSLTSPCCRVSSVFKPQCLILRTEGVLEPEQLILSD